MYKEVFRGGAEGLCSHYLDLFFRELITRGNIEHIKEIASMFGYNNDEQKIGNPIYMRFLFALKENYKK
jgi:hypothetical protein